MELVLATRNRKKIDEIMRITHNLGVRVLTFDDFPGCPEVEEDGTTFEENATKKAVTVAQFTGIASLADDSGLEVEALNGAPGVLSARYAGEGADDRKNVEALLREMQFLTNRKARFVCCMALAYPGGAIRIFNGYAEGTIGAEPRGSNGFGYDPVFYPAGHTITFAEMSDREKDSLSHRGMALEKLSQYINQTLKTK